QSIAATVVMEGNSEISVFLIEHAELLGNVAAKEFLVSTLWEVSHQENFALLNLLAKHISRSLIEMYPFIMDSLRFACGQRHLQCAKSLVRGGANVNMKNWCGMTPLHQVAKYGSIDAARFLIT